MHIVLFERLRLVFAVAAVVMMATFGCDGCEREVQQPQPWTFTSERAPYQITFPANWSRNSRDAINLHSDIEAHYEDRLFFLVIPQRLRFPEPDLLRFKQEGLRSLDETIDDFVVRRRGPLELDGVSGWTAFADGQFQEESISYIISYAIADGMGYQLIAFGPAEYESKLFEEVDLILSHWQFIDEDAKEESSSDGDTEIRHDDDAQGSLPDPDDGDGVNDD